MITLPYQNLIDRGWTIVSMCHYFVGSERHLSCIMVKNDIYIKADHKQDLEVFRILAKASDAFLERERE